jgi:hypothetical protein
MLIREKPLLGHYINLTVWFWIGQLFIPVITYLPFFVLILANSIIANESLVSIGWPSSIEYIFAWFAVISLCVAGIVARVVIQQNASRLQLFLTGIAASAIGVLVNVLVFIAINIAISIIGWHTNLTWTIAQYIVITSLIGVLFIRAGSGRQKPCSTSMHPAIDMETFRMQGKSRLLQYLRLFMSMWLGQIVAPLIFFLYFSSRDSEWMVSAIELLAQTVLVSVLLMRYAIRRHISFLHAFLASLPIPFVSLFVITSNFLVFLMIDTTVARGIGWQVLLVISTSYVVVASVVGWMLLMISARYIKIKAATSELTSMHEEKHPRTWLTKGNVCRVVLIMLSVVVYIYIVDQNWRLQQ